MANHRYMLHRSEIGDVYVATPQMGLMRKSAAMTYLANKLDKSTAKITSVLTSFGKAIAGTSVDFGLLADAGKFGNSQVTVLGGFAGHNGPWVFGKNFLNLIIRVSTTLRDALKSIIPTVVSGDVIPTVKTVFNETGDVYDQAGVGDVISLGGDDLAPDLDTDDEGVTVFYNDADNPAKWYGMSATVSVSELQIVKFTMPALPVGRTIGNRARIRVRTRCGFGEQYALKTVEKTIEFVAA